MPLGFVRMLVSLMANWVKVCQVAGAIAIHRQGESDYRNEAGHMTSAWSTQFSRADTGLLQLDMVDLLKLAEQMEIATTGQLILICSFGLLFDHFSFDLVELDNLPISFARSPTCGLSHQNAWHTGYGSSM